MPKLRLDDIDLQIIAALQVDGRMTAQEIAAKVGRSASPCARRVRQMEDAGVITGYAAVIDQDLVDLPISVFASIKLERQRESELERFNAAMARWPEIGRAHV